MLYKQENGHETSVWICILTAFVLASFMRLWLDDLRPPWKQGWVGCEWVKTAEEAIALLKTGRVEEASLDHDLIVAATMGNPELGELTGYDVAKFLARNPELYPVGGVTVHSLNQEGRRRMFVALHHACRLSSRDCVLPEWRKLL